MMRLYTRIVSSGLQLPEWLSEMSHRVQPICYHQMQTVAPRTVKVSGTQCSATQIRSAQTQESVHQGLDANTKVDKHGFRRWSLHPLSFLTAPLVCRGAYR